MSPFDPTADDLARIDRARAEDWLRAHGWEACPWMLPPDAGCWWRLVEGDGLDAVTHAVVVPADGVGDTARQWRDALRAVSNAHGLLWLALSAVVVAWMAPEGEP